MLYYPVTLGDRPVNSGHINYHGGNKEVKSKTAENQTVWVLRQLVNSEEFCKALEGQPARSIPVAVTRSQSVAEQWLHKDFAWRRIKQVPFGDSLEIIENLIEKDASR